MMILQNRHDTGIYFYSKQERYSYEFQNSPGAIIWMVFVNTKEIPIKSVGTIIVNTNGSIEEYIMKED